MHDLKGHDTRFWMDCSVLRFLLSTNFSCMHAQCAKTCMYCTHISYEFVRLGTLGDNWGPSPMERLSIIVRHVRDRKPLVCLIFVSYWMFIIVTVEKNFSSLIWSTLAFLTRMNCALSSSSLIPNWRSRWLLPLQAERFSALIKELLYFFSRWSRIIVCLRRSRICGTALSRSSPAFKYSTYHTNIHFLSHHHPLSHTHSLSSKYVYI